MMLVMLLYVPKALINLTMEASDVHSYNTRYASKQNLYRPASRTNYGLTRFKTKASKIWGKIPKQIKSLPFCSFKKQYKMFLNNQVELHDRSKYNHQGRDEASEVGGPACRRILPEI